MHHRESSLLINYHCFVSITASCLSLTFNVTSEHWSTEVRGSVNAPSACRWLSTAPLLGLKAIHSDDVTRRVVMASSGPKLLLKFS